MSHLRSLLAPSAWLPAPLCTWTGTRTGTLIGIAGCLALATACGPKSGPTALSTAEEQHSFTQCADVDRALPAGARASWGARAIGLRFSADRLRAPSVVIDGADSGPFDFLIEAVAFVGGARIELAEQVHRVSANGRVRVPIDLSAAIGLHPAQAALPTLVRVRAYVVDAAGRKTHRMASLPDLVMSGDAAGSMRLAARLVGSRETEDAVVKEVGESLDWTVIREMEQKARARRIDAGRN